MARSLCALPVLALVSLACVAPLATRANEPQAGDIRINPIDGAEMVWIPGGEFLMGIDAEELERMWAQFGWLEERKPDDESPLHRVRLDGVWMYRTEVTNEQFARFVRETGYRSEAERRGDSWAWSPEEGRLQKTEGADWQHPLGPDSSIDGKGDHPVVQVSWRDAVAYCLWAAVELPTEAQWEYAARGGDTGLNGRAHHFFPWGGDLPQGQGRRGNLRDESVERVFAVGGVLEGYDDDYASTAPVGSFEPNGFGVCDMEGNVSEWCLDSYDEGFYTVCDQQGVAMDPVCTSPGQRRVKRGSPWSDSAASIHTAQRRRGSPMWGSGYDGFRAVRPLGLDGDLLDARAALRAPKRNAAKARRLLLRMVRGDTGATEPAALLYAYVYLGYIADRQGKRKEAISWYKKGLEIEDPRPILAERLSEAREAARGGLAWPRTWIGHLEVGEPGIMAYSYYRTLRGNYEIYVMNADGSGQTNLTNSTAQEMQPIWSPDGSKIAFECGPYLHENIWVMNADGSDRTNLTNSSARHIYPNGWSPDSTKIAFTIESHPNGKHVSDIYVMNADGSGQTNLTKSGTASGPAWSPDGSKIAFTSWRGEGYEQIYVMNADGSGQTRLTTAATSNWWPAWSPDGSKIAFLSQRDGNIQIYTMSADGSGETNLSRNATFDHRPTWSADGSKIAFYSRRDGHHQIYVMNADGSGQTRLTTTDTFDYWPTWSPDGTRIAFVRVLRTGNTD